MKKIVAAVAAAGLMSLAACNSQQAERNEAIGEAVADNIQAQADNLSEAADEAPTDNAEAALENAADNMQMKADNAADNETDVN